MPSENLPGLSCRMKAAEILFSRSGENTPPDEENTDESYQEGKEVLPWQIEGE